MDEDKNTPFLDTVEGEASFFRSVMRARPVGIHRHFHVLAIRNAIHRDTGRSVSFEDIWTKLQSLYNLEALEALELEGYDSPGSSNSVHSARSPSPGANLLTHPFFHQEFTLPGYDDIEVMLSTRRMRGAASAPSSPAMSAVSIPSERGTGTPSVARASTVTSSVSAGVKRRAKDKGKMAGLVAGDSDSSALTQDSGDEGVPPPTPATDAGTEAAEDEDVEMSEQSPEPIPVPKSTKNSKSKKASGAAGRTRSTTTGSARTSKKKKR